MTQHIHKTMTQHPPNQARTIIPSISYRHSRVGGNLKRGGRHTGFKAVSTGQGKQQAQNNHLPSFPRRRETTGWMRGGRHRHTGFKAVSTGQCNNKTVPPAPSFPRRRESTGWMRGGRHRHSGFKAESTGWGNNKDKPTNQYPSPLMGEESKVRVTARQNNHLPSFPRRRESTGWIEKAAAIPDLTRNPAQSNAIIPVHHHRASRNPSCREPDHSIIRDCGDELKI